MTLVTSSNWQDCLHAISKEKFLGIDTETFGLAWSDRLFSIQISTEEDDYYFNFLDYDEFIAAPPPVLDYKIIPDIMSVDSRDTTWFAHNFKYDMAKLRKEGFTFKGHTHCTLAIERLIKNNLMGYSLDACLKRRGRSKNDKVKEYITKNKCYTWQIIPGKAKRFKAMHFDRVPFDIMYEYGCADTRDCRFLGLDQLKSLEKMEDKRILDLYQNEIKLTKVLHDMEWQGMLIDVEYTTKGLNHEQEQLRLARQRIEDITGTLFEQGPKWMQKTFDDLSIPYSRSPQTGRPIFDSDYLDTVTHQLAREILTFREHEKNLGTYYSSFLHLADENNRIHANINQGGTETARFSYSEPNLQNVPKEDEDWEELPFLVRSCFIADPDHYLVMIDYDQQEYRMMVDYAGEQKLIEMIVDGGLDVHQATADMMGVTRKQAKTLNFGLLYGMGVDSLASALKVQDYEAADLRRLYFSRLPKVKEFIRGVTNAGKERGWIFNWAGRRYGLPFNDANSAYKLPNHLIQGGCADVVRHAMVQIDEYLASANVRARMGVQIHDELLFQVHKDYVEVIPEFKRIMEGVYKPKNGLPLTCGVDYSPTSWGTKDKVKGMPCN